MTVYNYALHNRNPSLFTKYFPVQSYPSPGAEGSDAMSQVLAPCFWNVTDPGGFMDGSGSEGRGPWPCSVGFSRPHGFNMLGQEGSVPGYPPVAGCHQNTPVLGTNNKTQMPPYSMRYEEILVN